MAGSKASAVKDNVLQVDASRIDVSKASAFTALPVTAGR